MISISMETLLIVALVAFIVGVMIGVSLTRPVAR